ncbi:MAG: hypothetical protein WB611_20645 [Stellaceae bacterium]
MRLAVILLCAAITGSMVPSAKAAKGDQQRAAYAVVHQYEQYLNAGNTQGILNLFAPESVAKWNDKPTFVTRAQKQAGYDRSLQGRQILHRLRLCDHRHQW